MMGIWARHWMLVAAGLATLSAAGCEKKEEFPYGENLLVNGSFEESDTDGVPVGWEIQPFRGGPDDFAVRYGIDESTAADGEKSFFFDADPGSRRFFLLSQEVEVPEAANRIRLTGAMQLQEVRQSPDQYTMCNFLITFYDQDHQRFQEVRIADKRTHLRVGSQYWTDEDNAFRLPQGTRYVQISCVLGMTGRVWFDKVSLTVPRPIDWGTATTKNFVFHWLPDHPMPAGSQESQQQIFDAAIKKLNVETDVVIHYYFYPDTATIRDMLSLKGYQYVSWDDYEFHSINPNDDHEVVHFITDPVGRPPRLIAEGTVYWIHGAVGGTPLDEAIREVVTSGKLPRVGQMVDYSEAATLRPEIALPAAASFVAFFVDRFGTAKLMDLYAAANGINNYPQFAVAFKQACDMPIEEFEQAWRVNLEMRFARK